MDEQELIASARQGSEQAFEALYKNNLRFVKATGHAVLHTSDLDDLVQDTFLLAFSRLDSFAGNSSFRTWITRIALNRCLMILRKSRQASNGQCQLVDLEAVAESGDLLEACVFAAEDRELRSVCARLDLPKLLRILKPLERMLLRMAYIDERSEREIAERMGMTIPAVKSKLHHAKKRLRKANKKR